MKNPKAFPLSVFGSVLFLLACGPKVMVPPAVDLTAYDKIGLIRFSSNVQGDLEQFVTQKFVERMQSAQPGIRVLELGSEQDVLTQIEREQLDFEAIQELGKKNKVAAIFTGYLDVSDVKPKVNLSTLVTSMSAQADVEASLRAKLQETESRATLWTNSGNQKETVAHVTVVSQGPAHFDARDPESAYGKLVDGLVKQITHDFRTRYVRK